MPTKEQLYNEAEKLKDEGRLAESAAMLEELAASEPTYALAHSALAVIYTRLGQHEAAIRHGLKVCELEPDDPFSFTAMSITYQRAGRIPEAEECLYRARMMQGH